MKYLVRFEKAEPVRWLGHLDVLRAFERAIRRADLPIALSPGYNPRERITFASALAAGATAAAEPATVELTEPIEPASLVARLNQALPPGLQLLDAQPIADERSRDVLNGFRAAEYEVVCDCAAEVTLPAARRACEGLMGRPDLVVSRVREGRARQLDLRPLLLAVRPVSVDACRVTITVITAIGPQGSARPAEVVALLAESLPGLVVRRIHRLRLSQDD